MKKLFIPLVFLVSIALLITGCSTANSTSTVPAVTTAPPTTAPTQAAQPETIDIGYATIWPATHYTQVDQATKYFKMVEDATGGKYKLNIKYFPVGTSLDGTQLYDGVVKGIAESGVSSFGYTPGRFPVMLTMNQPGVAPPENSDAASAAEWEFYNKYKPKELEDLKILYLFGTGPGWINSNKPIRTVDDMKGLKIRVTGAGIDAVKAVGGEPVAMPMGDVYQAAQKGLINANVAPLETLEGWKHNEVFKYSTFVPYFYSEFFWVGMNLNKWNSLPKDLQDAFISVAPDAVKLAGQIWQYNQKHGMDYATAATGGHEFIYLSDTEAAKLKDLLKPIRAAYVSQLNSKGFNGEDIASSAASIVEKYNKLTYEPYTP